MIGKNSISKVRIEVLKQDFSLKMTVNYHREMVLNAICSRKPNEARDAAHAHLSFIKKILTNVT